MLENEEISGRCLNFVKWWPSAQSSSQNENFVNISKKPLKNRNLTFPVVRCFTWKLVKRVKFKHFVKFLSDFLNPVIPNEHCAKDLFSVFEEMEGVSANNYFLVSYDLCNLFTSIQLIEAIEIAVELIFLNKPYL